MKNERTKIAQQVTWVGFFINLILAIFKIVAGMLGKSTAMIADGIHSLSDFITDVIVIVFIGVSAKARDDDHRYGHGKYETFATLLISLALVIVGLGIFLGGLSKVILTLKGQLIEQPSLIALWAALVSIVVKEALFWYTKKAGIAIQSQAVIANAWHHRSDAFSSIGSALGVSGAIFLGESWRILDPIAGIIVSVFIVKVAVEIGLPAIHELTEKSLPQEVESQIDRIIKTNGEILAYHNLKTRKVGNVYAIDMHIKLDNDISFVQSHEVATDIEQKLRDEFGAQTITNIHTEPFRK
ncbi:MAG: cation-efflux pump [Porphyromonadaceae bacterium CG2_30_38_12]|nr:MAG: cation-efflux pump [Porphyromonadaceae bacterium CG2_30_38_12]